LDGITMEELRRPRRAIPLPSKPAVPVVDELPVVTGSVSPVT
jgi:hypothetical protein